ncbi:MAG: alkaline phosphatase [Ignavibacteriae bacterium]|nr:MAG: alkaline phosphatase [Ignavibacteriota bacterium]
MKLKYLIIYSLITALTVSAQAKKTKLLVGIVVDQMRYDYLEKYYNDFGKSGFKRLLKNGTNFTNCEINYIPSVTAAGHASIYTGTTPFYHGIISNNWIERSENFDLVNNCSTIKVPKIKTAEGISKTNSPDRLLSSTIGDQIRLNNFGKSKVYSISIKNRSAIMPAGKGANAAFWFDDETGKFISSFYYLEKLPEWLISFNNSGLIEKYCNIEWNLFKPQSIYSKLPEDNSRYEADVFNEGRTSFPHSLENVETKYKYSKFTHTPWGNQILIDLAKKLLVEENLGKGKYLDHLAISFSSPDKIGHDYGPQSYEVKDTYLRLDEQIADLLSFLDKQVGNDKYILFLTADHGGMENITHLKDMNFDTGVLENTNFFKKLTQYLKNTFGTEKIIKTRFTRNIYLDYHVLDSLNLKRESVEAKIKHYLLNNVPEIADVYTRTELNKMTAGRENSNLILNGYNKRRSGDILYSLKPHYLNWEKKYGTQHGSGHSYDTHIPLLFYGNIFPAKTYNKKVYVVDIAATIADVLGILKPSNCIGIPLVKRK